jgi:hypothetical protein
LDGGESFQEEGLLERRGWGKGRSELYRPHGGGTGGRLGECRAGRGRGAAGFARSQRRGQEPAGALVGLPLPLALDPAPFPARRVCVCT